jgi:hypothetical protein
MLSQSSTSDAADGFSSPAEASRGTSILRQRVAALTRTVDEREATIASLMRQLHRAKNDPAHSASVGRLTAGVAHQVGAPIGRIVESIRSIRRSFDLIERASAGDQTGNEELHRMRAAMPRLIEGALDDLERVAALVRAMENFSPADIGASTLSPSDVR